MYHLINILYKFKFNNYYNLFSLVNNFFFIIFFFFFFFLKLKCKYLFLKKKCLIQELIIQKLIQVKI